MYIQEYINNPHDKEIRKVLMNKKEGKIFINKSLKLKEEDKLKEANIENYTNSFVSNELKNKISDIVYKIVNRKELGEIYIIIEHQRAIDPRMRIRMCEYKSLVIRQALDEKQINAKGYKQPVVIGIVLYTGQKKWKEEKEVLKKLEEEGTEMMHIDEVLIRERDSWFEEGKKTGLVDGIAKGRKAGLADGKKSGKLEERLKIIRKMIKGKVKDDLIKEYTNANEQELEKIKKEMQSQAV